MQPYSLPIKVIEIIDNLDPADRGIAYSAIFTKIYKGSDPDLDSLTGAARTAYLFTMAMIGPEIARRKKLSEINRARQEKRRALEAEKKSRLLFSYKSPTGGPWVESYRMPDEMPRQSAPVPPSHIREMTEYVKIAQRTFPNLEYRHGKISRELQRRYPDTYRGLRFSPHGDVVLVPV